MNGARPLLSSEVSLLLAAADDPRLRCLVALLCHTGARLGEALALAWSGAYQGNQARPWISFERSTTKGKREGREVPVNAELAAELDRYQRASTGILTLFPSAPLFPGKGGRAWSRSQATRAIAELVRQAGLSGVSSHSCRKWYATELVSRGALVGDARELLGHRDLRTTQAYLDAAPRGRLRAAVDRLAGGSS